ncbi:hypothetical protein C9J60_32355 [Streptomyces sp. A244]|nr:hypothetical protein C9J60_32355 [Streptomyces sp. A244]
MVATVAIGSTPAVWLLGSADTGQLVGASVQAAVGIAALVWMLFQPTNNRVRDSAVRTGRAAAYGGATAVSGIRHGQSPDFSGGTVEGTGNASATGEGSSAVSGIDFR